MPQFIEKTPNGLETWIDDRNGDPGIDIHYRQDFEPVLNYATELRNDERHSQRGIKQDFWHYASLPAVVIMDLKIRHGIDVFKQEDGKRMFDIINREYPHLKATRLNHRVK